MKLTFVGDVHGKVTKLSEVVKNAYYSSPRCQTICVGDLGFELEIQKLKELLCLYEGHFFSVVGNHDYLPGKDVWPYLGNFAYFPNENIFAVRGAKSIDAHLRTEGLDWFANEELTYQEGLEAFDLYVACKPKIVVSHDCPQSVKTELFGYPDKTSTNQLLQAMFEAHQPELWVFGHYHRSNTQIINNTKFVCLDELETFTIDV
mgnify:CR=1 FL=1